MHNVFTKAVSLCALVFFFFSLLTLSRATRTAFDIKSFSKRSIPGLTGWSKPNFTGDIVFNDFCVPDTCCVPTPFSSGNQPVVPNEVRSSNVQDAQVFLHCFSTVVVWTSVNCSGIPVMAFNAFLGSSHAGFPLNVGSFQYVTTPVGLNTEVNCTTTYHNPSSP